MRLFKKLFGRKEPPLACLKRWAKSFDPRGGEDDTLQGVLSDAVLCLKDEGERNGWINGGEFHSESIDLLKRYLCEGPVAIAESERFRLATDLENIRVAALNRTDGDAYDELDRLVVCVAHWCHEHPTPIQRETGKDFW